MRITLVTDSIYDNSLTVTGITRKELITLFSQLIPGEFEQPASLLNTTVTSTSLEESLRHLARSVKEYGGKLNIIPAIVFVRAITNLGLVEAKELVNRAGIY